MIMFYISGNRSASSQCRTHLIILQENDIHCRLACLVTSQSCWFSHHVVMNMCRYVGAARGDSQLVRLSATPIGGSEAPPGGPPTFLEVRRLQQNHCWAVLQLYQLCCLLWQLLQQTITLSLLALAVHNFGSRHAGGQICFCGAGAGIVHQPGAYRRLHRDGPRAAGAGTGSQDPPFPGIPVLLPVCFTFCSFLPPFVFQYSSVLLVRFQKAMVASMLDCTCRGKRVDANGACMAEMITRTSA